MSKLNALLEKRFQKKEKTKISSLAEEASAGNLTIFSGIFKLGKGEDKERKILAELLLKFAPDTDIDLDSDTKSLLALTTEVKAITNQAALLHGERIKKAQLLLKKYREGAFTAWLIATYGNRQTPYNFLQYYDFYTQLPTHLQNKIEAMPRQAVYTLASREAPLSQKEEIVVNYKGETKEELLVLIRQHFPLSPFDRRREKTEENLIKGLEKLASLCQKETLYLTPSQKCKIKELLLQIQKQVTDSNIK